MREQRMENRIVSERGKEKMREEKGEKREGRGQKSTEEFRIC
jgi:hypothetical protein